MYSLLHGGLTGAKPCHFCAPTGRPSTGRRQAIRRVVRVPWNRWTNGGLGGPVNRRCNIRFMELQLLWCGLFLMYRYNSPNHWNFWVREENKEEKGEMISAAQVGLFTAQKGRGTKVNDSKNGAAHLRGV